MLTIIQRLQADDPKVQKGIYEKYANKLYWIAFRYVREQALAEDLVVESFLKIFDKCKTASFDSEKSFEAWISKIIVNESLMYLRKKTNFKDVFTVEEIEYISSEDIDAINALSYNEIIALITALPDGYRTVFNLYVMEGYEHKEIAQFLKISEGTSKSQLSHARKILQQKIKQQNEYFAGRFF